ncbi:MAG: exodeoxyribonuclease VII large subunit [Proteobacteria bacterium]|nr:exodeoxyribonuclease VII large subunit [Pseudomonadota bacterium]
MTDTTKIYENQDKFYMFKSNAWFVAYTDDPGILNIMDRTDARYFEKQNSQTGTIKRYWQVIQATFDSIKATLDSAGYKQFTGLPAPAQTEYRIARARPNTEVKTFTVKELSDVIRANIRTAFPDAIWLKGVVTDFKISDGGHVYFPLLHYSETQAESTEALVSSKADKINAVIWGNKFKLFQERIRAGKLRDFKNREAIRVLGKLDYYASKGQVSFYIEEVDETFAAEEKLRQRELIRAELIKRGIFQQNRALQMPFLPLRLAVFTNETAAGKGDFYENLKSSGYNFDITLFKVTLQGDKLESTFMEAFALLDKIGPQNFDYGIIVRGGGSSADLWDFNNIRIAEYIATSPLKFICGIGHDKDTTIIDEIALSFSTPSMVVHHLIDRLNTLSQILAKSRDSVTNQARQKLETAELRLQTLSEQCRNQIATNRDTARQTLFDLRTQITAGVQSSLHMHDSRLRSCANELQSLATKYQNMQERELSCMRERIASLSAGICLDQSHELERLSTALQNNAEQRLQIARSQCAALAAMSAERLRDSTQRAHDTLEQLSRSVRQLSPESLLVRGFAAVSDKDGRPVSSVENIRQNDTLIIRLKDGKLRVTVETVEPT